MNSQRLSKRIHDHFDKTPNTNIRWFIEVKEDLAKMNMGQRCFSEED